MSNSTQVYHVFIRATAEDIWQAVTSPERTAQYFYGTAIEVTPEVRTTVWQDQDMGTDAVLEFDPPRRLVHEWRSAYNPDAAGEPASRVTWEIEPRGDGMCLVTLTHDRLEASPKTAADVSGPGWMYVLSSMKTLLETGAGLPRAS
ncbi:SRPBCC family protein [Agromyces sp. SYSU K20354]|uniref:SRPBCC family protein n=1 Tax=Agromyces cavernae TaxID=2898659 RepID=UPI001E40FDFA|nr:SRPBCC family protein [Agromyces cavernae]MCD2442803.1 SRPBCC family protein [Agromyces cavernae]